MNDEWVSVVGWEKFQHYKDRAPKWIKNYIDLLRRDEYTDLTPAARSVLHGLWLLTASRPAANRVRARSLSSELKMRVTREHLESLNRAGFIEFSASGFVARFPKIASLETEVEKEKEQPSVVQPDGPLAENVRALFNPIIRKSDQTSPYTGCVAKRSVAGVKWEYDPLGTERPPAGWPHPQPSNAEIVAALEKERAA